VKIIKANNIYKAHIIIVLFFLLTLWGCGSGGSGSSEPGSGSSTANSVTLAWDKPDSNNDGSDLNDLAGYKIYYGTSSNNYTQSINVGNITSAVISNLSSGTWCFATTAYDNAGNESGYSNEECKTL
jgi:hypothetical protein